MCKPCTVTNISIEKQLFGFRFWRFQALSLELGLQCDLCIEMRLSPLHFWTLDWELCSRCTRLKQFTCCAWAIPTAAGQGLWQCLKGRSVPYWRGTSGSSPCLKAKPEGEEHVIRFQVDWDLEEMILDELANPTGEHMDVWEVCGCGSILFIAHDQDGTWTGFSGQTSISNILTFVWKWKVGVLFIFPWSKCENLGWIPWALRWCRKEAKKSGLNSDIMV